MTQDPYQNTRKLLLRHEQTLLNAALNVRKTIKLIDGILESKRGEPYTPEQADLLGQRNTLLQYAKELENEANAISVQFPKEEGK